MYFGTRKEVDYCRRIHSLEINNALRISIQNRTISLQTSLSLKVEIELFKPSNMKYDYFRMLKCFV